MIEYEKTKGSYGPTGNNPDTCLVELEIEEVGGAKDNGRAILKYWMRDFYNTLWLKNKKVNIINSMINGTLIKWLLI